VVGPYESVSDESAQRHFDIWGCGHHGCSKSLAEHLPQTSIEWHLLSSQRGKNLVALRRNLSKDQSNK